MAVGPPRARAPRAPEAIAASIRSKRTRTFLLEQVVLGALADGWRSPKERQFLRKLAQTLGIPEDELARIEADLAEFYAAQPDFVDRFRVQDRLADLREQLLGTVDELVERNWSVLVYEARQGRELTQALAIGAESSITSSSAGCGSSCSIWRRRFRVWRFSRHPAASC